MGLSIAGTFFSGISFIAYPSVVDSRGYSALRLGVLVCLPISTSVLRFWFLPRYLAGGTGSTRDQVLEALVRPGTRTFAAGLYILMRIGWMAAMIMGADLAIFDDGATSTESGFGRSFCRPA